MKPHTPQEESLAVIADAFPAHPLDPEGAFAEWGGTYLDADKFEAHVRGRRWDTLEPKFLEWSHDSLPFLGPAAFAEYLPAFLSAVVRKRQELDQLPSALLNLLTLDQQDEIARRRFKARLKHLTHAQQMAIAHALTGLEAAGHSYTDRNKITLALDSYWRDVERRPEP